MDPSETDNFKDQWKQALENASETPPPSVWMEIEARLDRDEKDIIPLWWRSPKLWYAAASIIALLLVGSGVWFNNRFSGNNLQITSAKKTTQQQEESAGDGSTNVPSDFAGEEKPLIAGANAQKEKLTNKNRVASARKAEQGKTTEDRAIQSKSNIDPEAAAVVAERSSDIKSGSKNILKNPSQENKREEMMDVAVSDELPSDVKLPQTESVERTGNPERLAAVVNPITPMAYHELEVYMQKRYVFFKDERIQDEKIPVEKKRNEYWAGVGIMPATFNPDVQIKESPVAFAKMQNSRQKSLSGTNKPGNSYALQTQGGVRLSKHWSLEMGVSYLKGNSKYEGGGAVLDAYNAQTTNVLENALMSYKNQLYSSPTFGSSDMTGNSLYFDVNKNVDNNYQFLQLPVQAGFTLNPDKKLSYSLLGGMMANFFLSNELEAASGDIIKTTASDEVYRSMNWSATTGLRFNYKLSTKWNASLMGTYQKAVSSGFKANQGMNAHPYLYGVSWGMRYSF